MRNKGLLFVIGFFLFIAAIFFYKTIFTGLIPFPGDLLVSEYQPWRTYPYIGYNPGSYPTKVQYFDTIRQMYPWKTFSIGLIKQGQIPLWNPYNFSGAPLLANMQSAVFYPFNLFYLIFSQPVAWTILVLLQPLLASIYTFLFARKIHIGKSGAAMAAVSYGYALFMTVFLEYNTIGHIMFLLPLALYAFEKLVEKPKAFFGILFSLSITAAMLAGHLQIAGFMLVFVGSYMIFRLPSIKKLLVPMVLVFIGIGIAGLQLFPTLELISLSARSPQEYTFLIEKLLLQPSQLILFFSPDFFGNPATHNYLLSDSYPGNAVYVGLISFVFALFALKRPRGFFAAAAFVLLFLFVRTPLTEILYKFEIPLISTGSPTNGIFLLSFSLAILAGFGIEKWLNKKKRSFTGIVLAIGVIFATTWVLVLFTPMFASTKNFIYSTMLFAGFAVLFFAPLRFKKEWIAFIFIAVTVVDLFYFFQKFNPFVPKALVFPEAGILTYMQNHTTIERFSGGTDANFATQYSIFAPEGYDPLYPRRYGEFIWAAKDGKIQTSFTNRTRSDAYTEGDFRFPILNTLGVRYMLERAEYATEKKFPVDQFTLIHEEAGWSVFENKKALPRVFLTGDYKVFKSKEEFENLFFDPTQRPETILLEEEPAGFTRTATKGEVVVISYAPNTVVLKTNAKENALLFLSDVYYPGWKATVDGTETRIYRANYAFRAVVVPANEHVVTFVYEPKSFSMGAKTTIISLVALMGFAVWLQRKGKKKHA